MYVLPLAGSPTIATIVGTSFRASGTNVSRFIFSFFTKTIFLVPLTHVG